MSDLGAKSHLLEAWRSVSKRQTAPGPDGETVRTFADNARANLQALHEELTSGRYRPRPARSVWLAKERGGERSIVVLCIRDRVAQGAARRALTPMFDPHLQACSYAYRHGLGALSAVRKLIEHRDAGRSWVVRGDIASFFDTVPHAPLLEMLACQLSPQATDFMQRILRVPIVEGPHAQASERGLLQGSPLSPLLSNVYLTPFDRALSQASYGLIRFADDFVIACASPSVAGQGFERTEGVLAALGLSLNKDKTRIVSFKQGFSFLGFYFSDRGVRIDRGCLLEFKDHVRHLLRAPTSARCCEVNNLIRGWRAYYRLGDVHRDFAALDEWLRDSFRESANVLESLVPRPARRRSGPALGGYTHRSASKPARAEPCAETVPPASPWVVACNAEGLPLCATREGARRDVASLPVLVLPHATKRALERTLTGSRLYHQANCAQRWHTSAGDAAAQACAAALADRLDPQAATNAYERALFQQAGDADMRWARGVLRRKLHVTVWRDLLAHGLMLGPENHRVPALAVALAATLEAPIADYALLRLATTGALEAPQQALERSFAFKIVYHGDLQSWRSVLALEARRLALAVIEGKPYGPWLWGART